jgi:hypothetical protein
MILYSIQLQANYNGNWSCHTYKPGSIWIMQIIKNLYTVAWPWFFLCWCNVLRWIWCLWCYSECIYPHRASLKNMPVHDGNRTYDLASPRTVLELEYLVDLWRCARRLVFKLHFSYFLNMRLMGCLHDGRWDDFWCIEISHQVKQKFKCLLTELKYCREDLVVQEDYYCCLNNFSFTVNYINL